VSFFVNIFDYGFVLRLNQTKGGTTLFIKPIGQELDSIFVLNLEIFQVSQFDGFPGRVFRVVTIHIKGHVSDSHEESIYVQK
jgi:hypothetical protein